MRPVRSPQRLPQEVYVRRRVAALVILLAVAALVVWGLTAFARSGSDEPEQPTTTAPETMVTTPTEPDPGASATETETETETKSTDEDSTEPSESESDKPDEAALASKKTCELEDLQLTVKVNKTAFDSSDPEDQPDITVEVKNPTGADCDIDATEDKLRFEVYAIGREGFQPVWGDTDCYDPVINGEQTFPAGESRHFSATWSRLGSSPGQCSAREPVAPGAYVASVSLGDNASEGVTFNIN
ncbi:hypothetical protein KBX17_06350 [Corynebacterium sp. CCUG 65737]|nr:hypothetical protein [Corynebacterium sp. CCUG 65737]